jgi:putative hemolysin
MLWKGIASYAALCNARYMIGCSSITSQDENEGAALFEKLREKYLAPPGLRTQPTESHRCGDSESKLHAAAIPEPPRLFRAYLDISARLCGPPAIDREFGTIDFLTLLDLQVIPQRLRTRFF